MDHSEAPDQSVQDRLTNEEENAVNYVGGYRHYKINKR